MLAWENQRYLYAAIPEGRRPPQWTPIGKSAGKFLNQGWLESGFAAALGPDLRTLMWKRPGGRAVTWKLPGAALGACRVARVCGGIRLGGRQIFPVSVRLGKGRALAVCREDGSVRLEWPDDGRGGYWLAAAPDGSVSGWRDAQTLYVVSPDGDFRPPIDLRRALEEAAGSGTPAAGRPSFLHADGSAVWLLAAGRVMIQVDGRDGRLLGRWPLPADGRYRAFAGEDYSHHAARDGLFFQAGRRLYFVNWEGRRRDLGAI